MFDEYSMWKDSGFPEIKIIAVVYTLTVTYFLCNYNLHSFLISQSLYLLEIMLDSCADTWSDAVVYCEKKIEIFGQRTNLTLLWL